MRKYHVDRNHFLFKLSKRATTLEIITMGIIISFVINPVKTPTPFIIIFTIIHLHIHRKIQCFFSSIFSFLLYQVKIELFFVWVLFCPDVNFLFLLVVIFLFNSYCGIAFPFLSNFNSSPSIAIKFKWQRNLLCITRRIFYDS